MLNIQAGLIKRLYGKAYAVCVLRRRWQRRRLSAKKTIKETDTEICLFRAPLIYGISMGAKSNCLLRCLVPLTIF